MVIFKRNTVVFISREGSWSYFYELFVKGQIIILRSYISVKWVLLGRSHTEGIAMYHGKKSLQSGIQNFFFLFLKCEYQMAGTE